jgi:hypothetical protein
LRDLRWPDELIAFWHCIDWNGSRKFDPSLFTDEVKDKLSLKFADKISANHRLIESTRKFLQCRSISEQLALIANLKGDIISHLLTGVYKVNFNKNAKVADKKKFLYNFLNDSNNKAIKNENNNSQNNNSTDYILSTPHTLCKTIIEYYNKTKSFPITIPMKTSHPKIMPPSFDSHDKFHKDRLQRLPDIEKELYMIENKLDGYYKILNPIDIFYKKTYYTNTVNNNNYYQEHFSHINKFTIVKDYLVGLNWVMNYYLNTDPTYKNIDISWYYPHNRSPLLHDIVIAYDKNIITMNRFNPFNNNNNNFMTPIEHFIYVSPFHSNLSETMKKYLGSLSHKQIYNIIMFIKANKKYYYDLDTIYKNLKNKKEIDCSGSIFISKCHLLFMENYIDMISFLNDIRKYIAL